MSAYAVPIYVHRWVLGMCAHIMRRLNTTASWISISSVTIAKPNTIKSNVLLVTLRPRAMSNAEKSIKSNLKSKFHHRGIGGFRKQRPERSDIRHRRLAGGTKSPALFRSRASLWLQSPRPRAAPRQSPALLPPSGIHPRAAPPPLLSRCAPSWPNALPAACARTGAAGCPCVPGRLPACSRETRRERSSPAAAGTETQRRRKETK